MIDYKKFRKYMTMFKEMLILDDKLNDVLCEISPDFGGYHNSQAITLFLDMIKEMVKDKCEWIEYYIWELDWGKNWQEGMVTEKDGTDVPLKTLKDLHSLLESEYED